MRSNYTLLLVLLLAGCAKPSPAPSPTGLTGEDDAPQPTASTDEESGLFESNWEQSEAYFFASGDDRSWKSALEAAREDIVACFLDYEAFIDDCRAGVEQPTKVHLAFTIRQEQMSEISAKVSGVHPRVEVADLSIGSGDACMEDDYENGKALDNCVGWAIGERLEADPHPASSMTLLLSNTEPSMGVISAP